ncbi:hypothetical protein ACF3DV_33595 (plasmid) [Chlorogloeopsis fritschii PCC 9212]|uniref:hypothetical protein n=1 Tax=Chlorogloeopsis fritschii TaxID=1124 RepID=UPI00030AEE0D|nr:hypothetical protein [Chlorogloeopsis fritschii]
MSCQAQGAIANPILIAAVFLAAMNPNSVERSVGLGSKVVFARLYLTSLACGRQ